MTFPPISDLLSTAQETAVAAGKLAREMLAQPREVANKGFRDLVTDADVAAQKRITDTILNHFPEHGFLTEEEDSTLPTDGRIIWIIDPIDGTTNYSRQQPNFCVSIAAARPVSGEQLAVSSEPYSLNKSQFTIHHSQFTIPKWEVLVGAIYDPVREELFSAARGLGAAVRDGHGRITPLHVSPINQLEQSLLLMDWGGKAELREQAFAWLEAAAPHVFTIRALGSATLALAWVAAARADLYFNFNVKPWDLAAALVIIEEAGGQVTAANGGPLDWRAELMDCVASNGRLHQAFLALPHLAS
jgi:myo-inositol-1(or 4)-monophosphatase